VQTIIRHKFQFQSNAKSKLTFSYVCNQGNIDVTAAALNLNIIKVIKVLEMNYYFKSAD